MKKKYADRIRMVFVLIASIIIGLVVYAHRNIYNWNIELIFCRLCEPNNTETIPQNVLEEIKNEFISNFRYKEVVFNKFRDHGNGFYIKATDEAKKKLENIKTIGNAEISGRFYRKRINYKQLINEKKEQGLYQELKTDSRIRHFVISSQYSGCWEEIQSDSDKKNSDEGSLKISSSFSSGTLEVFFYNDETEEEIRDLFEPYNMYNVAIKGFYQFSWGPKKAYLKVPKGQELKILQILDKELGSDSVSTGACVELQ